MSFYINLPSNSSMKTYPDNTQASFTTLLKVPIHVPPGTKVALVVFECNKQIETNVGILKIRQLKHNSNEFEDDIEINFKIQEHTPFERFLQILNREIANKFYDLKRTQNNSIHALRGKIPLFSFIPGGLLFKFEIPLGFIVQFNYKLAAIMGFENQDCTKKAYDVEIDKHDLFINTIDSFLVYADIIADQYYGDTLAPIIRSVMPTGQTGDSISIQYQSPHYVNLKKTFIDTIHINIRDSEGNLIHFTNLLGKVNIKLHFKLENE